MPQTTAQLRQQLSALTLARLGFDGNAVEQGEPEWHAMRLGVITASRAKELISKGRDKKSAGEAAKTYQRELIAEICTANAKRSGGRSSAWGHEFEDDCIGLFEFSEGIEVQRIPFVFGDERMRYGCSPDGLIGDLSGLEVKNPHNTAVYLDFVLNGEVKPEYIEQVQFSMFVTGRETWHFANHDPDMRKHMFHSKVFERDEDRMKTYADAVEQFIYDMDSALAKLGFQFGDQWTTNKETAWHP